MKPSRLTASLARGQVGSVSSSTIIHVLRLVQRRLDTDARAYATLTDGLSLNVGSSVVTPIVKDQVKSRHQSRSYASGSSAHAFASDEPDHSREDRVESRSNVTGSTLRASEPVAKFWDVPGDSHAESSQYESRYNRPIDRNDEQLRAVYARKLRQERLPWNPNSSRHSIYDDLEGVTVRDPSHRHQTMTRSDGSVYFDHRRQRYHVLKEDTRILNQGAPTNDPNQLTRDPNWYKAGYILGNTRKNPKKKDDKLAYLDQRFRTAPDPSINLKGLSRKARRRVLDARIRVPGHRRMQDIKRILLPSKDYEPKWKSGKPLNGRSWPQLIDPHEARRRTEIYHERLEAKDLKVAPLSSSVNKYSNRRQRVAGLPAGITDRAPDLANNLALDSPVSGGPQYRSSVLTPLQDKLHQQTMSILDLKAPGRMSKWNDRLRNRSSASKAPGLSPSELDALDQTLRESISRRENDNRYLFSTDLMGLRSPDAQRIYVLPVGHHVPLDSDDMAVVRRIAQALESLGMHSPNTSTAASEPLYYTVNSMLVDQNTATVGEYISVIESLPEPRAFFTQIESIRRLVNLCQVGAEPKQWLWSAGRLIDALQAVKEGYLKTSDPGLFPFAHAVIGYILARTAYKASEAKSELVEHAQSAIGLAAEAQEVSGSISAPTVGDTYQLFFQATTSAHLGHWEAARASMTKGLDFLFALQPDHGPVGSQLRLLVEYRELLAGNDRLSDLVEMVMSSSEAFRQALLDVTIRNSTMLLFRQIMFNALATMPGPVEWFAQNVGWEYENSDKVGIMYTALTRYSSKVNDALEFVEQLYTNKLPIPLDASARHCWALFRLGQTEDAQALYALTRSQHTGMTHQYLSKMLAIFATHGLYAEASTVYAEIDKLFSPTFADKIAIAEKQSRQGRPEAVLQLLGQNFGPQWTEDPSLLSILFQANANTGANASEATERLYQRLVQTRPTVALHNIMIKFYTEQGDADKALTVFRSLLRSDVGPNHATFEQLLWMYAERIDLSNIFVLLDAMRGAGVQVTETISATIIRAYVNAGDWDGAAQYWQSLAPEMQNSSPVAGALLRAFVMLAAPPSIVLSVFRGIRNPSNSHWSLLLLSYCDAGQMAAAAKILESMDRRARTSAKSPTPDLYAFSILLYGYLRNGQNDLAQATYNEMRRRRKLPSVATYNAITQSFIDSGRASEERLDRVHRFAMAVHMVAKEGGVEARRHGDEIQAMFASMITLAGDIGQIENARAYFDASLPDTSKPKLRDLKSVGRLMDVYRKQGDSENVMKLWKTAMSMAKTLRGDSIDLSKSLIGTSSSDTSVKGFVPSTTLAVCLSITMETLADVGEYAVLKDVWNEARMEGFGFTPTNFDIYAIALAKTGDVEGAFYIVDKVMVPRYKMMQDHRAQTIQAIRQMQERPAGSLSGEPLVKAPSGATPEPLTAQPQSERSGHDPDDMVDPDDSDGLSYDPSKPFAQRMHAALYTSDLVAEGQVYDPELFGGPADFAKEGPPAVASTLPTSPEQLRSPTSLSGSQSRSNLMSRQRLEGSKLPLDVPSNVQDLTAHLLMHFRPDDDSWRPTSRVWSTLNDAYRDLQSQRKDLADQVLVTLEDTLKFGGESTVAAGSRGKLAISVEKELDDVDPRREPRLMPLKPFNDAPVRDRFGQPMKSTPVVVLWRLNAIYPKVVRGIYKFREYAAGMAVQHSVQKVDRQVDQLSKQTENHVKSLRK
ncbi:hypothetical protein BD324DRAFT_606249, partial [Kockovaella imperatae]